MELQSGQETDLQEERLQLDQEVEDNPTDGGLNDNESSERTHNVVGVEEENASVVADSSSPSNLSRREHIVMARSEIDHAGPNESAVDSSSSSNLSRRESIIIVRTENDNDGPSKRKVSSGRNCRNRGRRADRVDEHVYESPRIHRNSDTTSEGIPLRQGNDSDNDVVVMHDHSASERLLNTSRVSTISLREDFERRKAPLLQIKPPRSKRLMPSYSLEYPVDRGDSSSSREVVDLTVDEPLPKRKKIVRLSKLPANEAIVDRLKKELTCPVCLGAISKMASTTCGHIFCYNCIQQSVALRGRCPICSARLVVKDVHRVFI